MDEDNEKRKFFIDLNPVNQSVRTHFTALMRTQIFCLDRNKLHPARDPHEPVGDDFIRRGEARKTYLKDVQGCS